MDSAPASGSALPPVLPESARAFVRRSSTSLKLVVIAVLIALLHVPLLFVWDTLGERKRLRDLAAAGIGQTWGAEQTILGRPDGVKACFVGQGQPERCHFRRPFESISVY